jgi:hypothetical protein
MRNGVGKTFAWLAFGILITTCRAQSVPGPTCGGQFDFQPWLEDFGQLTAEMAAHYANLESSQRERHMDLPKLRQKTETKLRQACDELQAQKNLRGFIEAFGDGYLELKWPKPSDRKTAGQTSSNSTSVPKQLSLCPRLGYQRSLTPGVDFSQLPAFTSFAGGDANWCPAGILQWQNRTKPGVIRIALFSEHAFPEACELALSKLHLAKSRECDTQCENIVEREIADQLTAAIVRRSMELQHAGPDAILVDITNNRGGSDWVEAPPRVLSRVPLHESRLAFLKHEHWTKPLQDQLQDIETDLKNDSTPKRVLQEASVRLRSGIARSQEPCDRTHVWTEGTLDCSSLIGDVIFTGGILPFASPGSFESLESKTTLFHALRYSYSGSTERPPLYVLVDRETWSAAEYFAAILQDNKAATIAGELTGGAGCGYTNGGIPGELRHPHVVVKMPDCGPLGKDGSDEVNGVIPDILVPWAERDTPYTKAVKLSHARNAALAAESSKPSSH